MHPYELNVSINEKKNKNIYKRIYLNIFLLFIKYYCIKEACYLHTKKIKKNIYIYIKIKNFYFSFNYISLNNDITVY